MTKKYRCICILAAWLVLTAALWLGKPSDISLAERRQLAKFPTLRSDTLLSGSFMSGFESYCQDQFPLREAFRGTKALFDCYAIGKPDSNGIAIVGTQAVKLEYPLNRSAVDSDAAKFTAIYNQYLQGANRVLFCVVPDKAYYVPQESFPTMDYDALFDAFKGLDFAEFVDIRDELNFESYYATDLHWNQRAICEAAKHLCGALDASPMEDLQEKTLGQFYGVYKGQSALPMNKDTMTLLTSPVIDDCSVTAFGSTERTAVYDLPKFEGRDPYDVFLSGASGYLRVENPAGREGKQLVVFRDSFGSAMVPLLLHDYETTELVDIRYLPASQLGKVMEFEGKDVLFLYSTTVLNTPGIFK